MDGVQQLGLPLLGIAAAAAITFYAISFNELREKSIRDLGEREESQEFKSSLSSRERRARRKAYKQSKS